MPGGRTSELDSQKTTLLFSRERLRMPIGHRLRGWLKGHTSQNCST